MIRIGHGYDVHRFACGRKLVLCGETIDFDSIGLVGHSDADVAVHSLCDAILGACGCGDIGKHFPDNDDKYKGISSMILLAEVVKLVASKGLRPYNVDMTIVAQMPKISPYIDNMINNIAACIGVSSDMVNVKATTTEGLGFVGRKEGIACYAVCTVVEMA